MRFKRRVTTRFQRVAVIGVGNVAIDVARILCRTPEELRATDMAEGAIEALSKSRVKAAAKKSNVGSEFYGALEKHVRQVIAEAEARCAANGRKTLRPQDV